MDNDPNDTNDSNNDQDRRPGQYIYYFSQPFHIPTDRDASSEAPQAPGSNPSTTTTSDQDNRPPPEVLSFVQGILSAFGLPNIPITPANVTPGQPGAPSGLDAAFADDIVMTPLPNDHPNASPVTPGQGSDSTAAGEPNQTQHTAQPNTAPQSQPQPGPAHPPAERWIFDVVLPGFGPAMPPPTNETTAPSTEPPQTDRQHTHPPFPATPWLSFADFMRGVRPNATPGTETANDQASPSQATPESNGGAGTPLDETLDPSSTPAEPGATPPGPGGQPPNPPHLHGHVHIQFGPIHTGAPGQAPNMQQGRAFTIPLEALLAFGGLIGPLPERPPDYRRARTLLAGIERVPEGLAKRLEKVDQVSGGNGAPCAVCFEPLVLSDEQKIAKQLETEEEENKRRQEGVPPTMGPPVKEFIAALPCTHVFHSECLIPWFARNTTCPSCRFDLDPQSLTLKQPTPATFVRHHPYMRNSGTSAPPEPRPRKWTVPDGKSLRSWVEERERREGLRCDEISCGRGPCDDDEVSGEPYGEVTKKLVVVSPGPLETKHCGHRFHPECIVSAARVAGWGTDVPAAGGEEPVEVSCPVCRAVGTVVRSDWQEGMALLS